MDCCNALAGTATIKGTSLQVAVTLFPLFFEFEDLLPGTGLRIGQVGIIGNDFTPAHGIVHHGLVFSAHGDGAICTEWRLDGEVMHDFSQLLAVGGVS